MTLLLHRGARRFAGSFCGGGRRCGVVDGGSCGEDHRLGAGCHHGVVIIILFPNRSLSPCFSTNSTFSLRVRQEAAGGFAQSAVKMSEKARRSWRELSDQGGAKNNVWPVRSMLQPHLLD